MKVSDILRVKGNTLYTVTPDEPLARAIDVMAVKDIGSLVVMEHGELVGMLTFREVILCIVKNARAVVDSQNFENKMLKAYIRDWPGGEEEEAPRV
jgi:predicted transcriptional regulator